MVTAVGFWEHKPWVYATSRAVKDKIRLWTLTMKAFGVSKLILVDVDQSQPECRDAEIALEIYSTLEEVLAAHDGPVVLLAQTGETKLAEFEHPTGDVLYVAGPDYGQLDATAGTGRHVVSVETPVNVPLWSHVALAIALYDRSRKQG